MRSELHGKIVADGDRFKFVSERGGEYSISAIVEEEFEAGEGKSKLSTDSAVTAKVNELKRKVEALYAIAGSILPKGDFHNPYNFVPAPPAAGKAAGKAAEGGIAKALEQGKPAGHHRWHEDRYSGRIEIEIEAITPLLIPDAFGATSGANDHKTFETLRDATGNPLLPVTSLKGALRSAYEAITNSRFGVMDGNKLLQYRDPSDTRRKFQYQKPPRALLHPSLHPAQDLAELSPADRVFGWAHEKGDGAFRGQMRIAPVRFLPGNGIAEFESPLPLAILGEPMPKQWLFYGAADENGTPLQKGAMAGSEGYKKGKGLRGRKTYPHQNIGVAVSTYWNQTAALAKPERDILAANAGSPVQKGTGIYREYVRQSKEHDKQNRSIKDWVEPGAKFATSIDVVNLSGEELGALLWLLDLNSALGDGRFYHLKFGGGKPLGFGSVKVRVTLAELYTGKAKAESLAGFSGKPETLPDERTTALIGAFRDWMAKAYGTDFASIAFIKAFLQSAAGHTDGLPTHYPRRSKEPNPRGENFLWFVENAKDNKRNTLPTLADDPGLPFLKP